MRKPTTREQLYTWHANAMLGLAPVIDQTPQCGWYKRKLVKGGVFVPARIWMVQEIDVNTGELISDELLQCEVNGTYADPDDAWSWLCSNPISVAEFLYLTARIEHAVRREPDDPFADARKPVDLNRTPLHW